MVSSPSQRLYDDHSYQNNFNVKRFWVWCGLAWPSLVWVRAAPASGATSVSGEVRTNSNIIAIHLMIAPIIIVSIIDIRTHHKIYINMNDINNK